MDEETKQIQYLESNRRMIQVLEQQQGERFKNSKFLQFLKKVDTGEYELRDTENKLILHPEKAQTAQESKLDSMEQHFTQSEQNITEQNQKFQGMNQIFAAEQQKQNLDAAKLREMENAWNAAEQRTKQEIDQEAEKKAEELQKLWQEMARNYDPQNPELTEKLQKEWENSFDQWENSDLSKAWQAASDIEDMQYIDHMRDYNFSKENEFDQLEKPHLAFLEEIKKGNSYRATKALESHLKRHPSDHKGWKTLGELLQELDDDQRSVAALSKAIDLNRQCRDSLLLMGVSCVNILDELHSMMYLHRWLKLSPEYAELAGVIFLFYKGASY